MAFTFAEAFAELTSTDPTKIAKYSTVEGLQDLVKNTAAKVVGAPANAITLLYSGAVTGVVELKNRIFGGSSGSGIFGGIFGVRVTIPSSTSKSVTLRTHAAPLASSQMKTITRTCIG